MEQEERRRTKPEFNGCIRYKRGEYCQPCVAMASNYTYVGIIDRRAVFHQYTRTPSPREQKLVDAALMLRSAYSCGKDFDLEPQHDNEVINYSRVKAWSAITKALSAYDAPGSQEGEKAPIGEEELAELLHKEHDLWLDGKIPDRTLNVFQHQSRALAKRLGWM